LRWERDDRDIYEKGNRRADNSTFWDEEVDDWIEKIDAMNSLLGAVDANDFQTLYSGLTGSIQVELDPRIPDRNQLEAALSQGLPPPIDLTLRPESLVVGMRLQFALHYSEPIGELRKCGQCSKWFYVGPGTGHRSNAKYCSQQCYGRAKHERHKKRKAGAQTPTTKGARRKK